MSLLIIRCPFKPFVGEQGDGLSQALFPSKAEEFSWSLLDGSSFESSATIGTVESMPYAEMALVLIPTLDVRLVEMKIPLVSEKKILSILPGLLEDYLLGGIADIQALVLPPLPGSAALIRTVAILDRAWFDWLTDQLSGILSPQLRLVPDCFLLGSIQAAEKEQEPAQTFRSSIAYEFVGSYMVWTVHSGILLGASWIEQFDDDHHNEASFKSYLPTQLQDINLTRYTWDVLLKSAQYFMENKAYRSINLLPKSFRLVSKSTNKKLDGDAFRYAGFWEDLQVWRKPLRWLMYCICTLLIGFVIHLSWIAVSDWRWIKKMQDVALLHLTKVSIAEVSRAQDQESALRVMTHQITQEKRYLGLLGDADFSTLSKKLQQLNTLYGGSLIRSIHYNGYDMEFEVDPRTVSAESFSAAKLVRQARALDLGVVMLGRNRFRLFPYSGLGEDL